jgi:hypothetical protein
MSAEQRYVDLKKLCERIDSELFDPLSWILLLNLDFIPQEDIEANPNLKFSFDLMNGDFDAALKTAKYETFFALAKRRVELIEKSGFKQH